MHICILTTAHPVGDVRVYEKITKSLLGAGHRVSWVGPGNEFKAEQGLDYHLVGLPESRLGRFTISRKLIRAAKNLDKVDLFYCPDPDAVSVVLKLAQNEARVVFDIHELFHGPMLERWIGKILTRILSPVLQWHIRKLTRKCDLVMGVNQRILMAYAEGHPCVQVVRSCASFDFQDKVTKSASFDWFRVMHGKADPSRGTPIVAKAVATVKDRCPELRVIMFGDESSDTPLNQELKGSSAIELRPRVPFSEMSKILGQCEVGLIAYDRALGVDSLPNRIFEYMAAGMAIVVPEYSSEMVDIVRKEDCGLWVDFEDDQAVAGALIELYGNNDRRREMGRRALEAFRLRHNWDVEFKAVLSLFESWDNEGSNSLKNEFDSK